MRTARVTSSLIFSCFIGLGAAGCTAGSGADDIGESEAAIVSQTRLDRVTPKEVAATWGKKIKPEIQACITARPAITQIDASTIDGFWRGPVSYYEVGHMLESMLAEPGVTSIPVASLLDQAEPWASRVMSQHVDADGFYTPPSSGVMAFYEAEKATREAKAFSLAAKPGGRDLREIRAQWAEVQSVQNNLDSAWHSPVKVSGDNLRIGEIAKAMQLPWGVQYQSWGDAAIEDFYTAGEGPEEAAEFDPIMTFVKSSAIKKRWYFAGGGDGWSSNALIVLDEHNQLWGMSMGYSE